MFKYGFTQGNRLVIHTSEDDKKSDDEQAEIFINGFKEAYADPRYMPGHTLIVGLHISGNLFTNMEDSYKLAKVIASGKPRLISLILYGNLEVGEDTFKLIKDFLKTMDVEFDWHYELQETLLRADEGD